MNANTACELFQRCVTRHGSDDWREFLRRYDRRIRRTVSRAFRRRGLRLPEQDREELVQELYCRLLAIGRRGFRGRSELQFWTYLGLVARSLAVDHQRALGAGKRRMIVYGLDRPGGETAPWIDDRASAEASPEERYLESERRRVFLARCRQIARRDRPLELRVLRMALLEGWSSREIARRLEGSVTASQVDNLVHRLRARLAEDGIRMPRRRGGSPPLRLAPEEPVLGPQGAVC